MGSLPHVFGLMFRTPFNRHLPKIDFDPRVKEIFAEIRELLEAGKITPVIDKVFPLDQVKQAMRYMQDGKAKGRIVIVPKSG